MFDKLIDRIVDRVLDRIEARKPKQCAVTTINVHTAAAGRAAGKKLGTAIGETSALRRDIETAMSAADRP